MGVQKPLRSCGLPNCGQPLPGLPPLLLGEPVPLQVAPLPLLVVKPVPVETVYLGPLCADATMCCNARGSWPECPLPFL
eukprot:10240049-Prorocentrum_lima.AAC.1